MISKINTETVNTCLGVISENRFKIYQSKNVSLSESDETYLVALMEYYLRNKAERNEYFEKLLVKIAQITATHAISHQRVTKHIETILSMNHRSEFLPYDIFLLLHNIASSPYTDHAFVALQTQFSSKMPYKR